MFRVPNGLFRVYISCDETRVSTFLLLPRVYFGSSHVCCNLVPALFSLPIPYLSVSVYFFLFLHFNIIISHVSFSLSHFPVLLFTSTIFHCFSSHYSSFHLLHSTFMVCCNVNSHSSYFINARFVTFFFLKLNSLVILRLFFYSYCRNVFFITINWTYLDINRLWPVTSSFLRI